MSDVADTYWDYIKKNLCPRFSSTLKFQNLIFFPNSSALPLYSLVVPPRSSALPLWPSLLWDSPPPPLRASALAPPPCASASLSPPPPCASVCRHRLLHVTIWASPPPPHASASLPRRHRLLRVSACIASSTSLHLKVQILLIFYLDYWVVVAGICC